MSGMSWRCCIPTASLEEDMTGSEDTRKSGQQDGGLQKYGKQEVSLLGKYNKQMVGYS